MLYLISMHFTCTRYFLLVCFYLFVFISIYIISLGDCTWYVRGIFVLVALSLSLSLHLSCTRRHNNQFLYSHILFFILSNSHYSKVEKTLLCSHPSRSLSFAPSSCFFSVNMKNMTCHLVRNAFRKTHSDIKRPKFY